MEDFTAINTEEEFQAAVLERYGNVSDFQNQIAALTTERDAHAATIAQLQAENHRMNMETMRHRVAREKGIPAEFASRLTGEDEAAMLADAESLLGDIRKVQGPAPRFTTEAKAADPTDAALLNMLNALI